jgi:dTMP kinase
VKRKGYFVTFEGGEGTGKSTHLRFVASYLRRRRKKVIVLREPGSTKIGEQIRKVLLNPRNGEMTVEAELLLYLAARAQIVREMIEPALHTGKVVLCDRFEDSTIVYQGMAGGLFNVGGRLTLPVQRLIQLARGNVKPDLTFLLDVGVRQGLKRSGRRDRMEKKSLTFHQNIRRGYLRLARRAPRRIVVVDTSASKDEVQDQIRRRLARVFG